MGRNTAQSGSVRRCTEPTRAMPNAVTACMGCDVRVGLQSAQANNICTDNSIVSLPFCDHLFCTCAELASEESGHMQILNEEKQLFLNGWRFRIHAGLEMTVLTPLHASIHSKYNNYRVRTWPK